MLKKILVSAAAGAVALGGLAFLGVGTADAKKAVLNGNLHCNTHGVTTFSPGGVLALSQLPKPKDHKVKVNTTTTATACTHTSEPSGLPSPTGWTSTSKSKVGSRLCQAFTSVGGGKTKYVFSTGAKSKGGLPGTSTTKADNGTPANDADNLTIPATTDPGFNAFLVADGNDQLVTLGTGGTLAGKAYAGKTINSRSVAGSIISKIGPCSSATGLTSVTSNGTEGFGLPA